MKTLILNLETATRQELEQTALMVRGGAVAVFPTDTVYGIGTNARLNASIDRIYEIKQRRPDKPLPLFAHSALAAKALVRFTPEAHKLTAKFWPGRLTIILPPATGNEPLARGAAGIGLRVPGHEKLLNWLVLLGEPLAQTSANLSGSPALTAEKTVLDQFTGKADIIFTGGTLTGKESTVADLTGASPLLLREGAISKTEFLNAL